MFFTSAEPPSVQPQEDSQLCESQWRSRAELLPQVKEEPKLKNTQTDCLQKAGDCREDNVSHVELQKVHPEAAQSESPPPLTSIEMKTEQNEKQQLASSLSSRMVVHSEYSATKSDSCGMTAKRSRPPQTDQQLKGLLCSNGKKSMHILQIKNVRSPKLPLSRSSQPSQSIQRWHSCKECGKGFSFACQLEVHMRWHTKEKPYSCAVCRKSFTTVSMLKRHHRIHTGEKPFHCNVCGKCFNQSAHLNTHFRLHTRERASWNRSPQCK